MAVRLVVRAPFAADASAELAFEFDQTRVLIGRGASADVRLPHAAVSESHAAMRLDGSTYALVDEGSTNGTSVNGVRLVPGRAKALRSGDVIDVAGFLLTFHAGVATTLPTSSEQTAALARRLVREVLDPHGAASDPARLVVVGGPQSGARVELPPPPARLLIGRGEMCDLVLLDADCSREHVELVRDLDGTLARDLGSKNGSRINERPLRERRLRDRDELLIGQTVVVYEDPAEASIRALEGVPDAAVPEVRAAGAVEASGTAAAASTESATGTASATASAAATATATESAAAAASATASATATPSATESAAGTTRPATAPAKATVSASAPVSATAPMSASGAVSSSTSKSGAPAESATPSATDAISAEVPRDRRRSNRVSADIVIYVLAGLVLAASAVALFVLLRAG